MGAFGQLDIPLDEMLVRILYGRFIDCASGLIGDLLIVASLLGRFTGILRVVSDDSLCESVPIEYFSYQ